MLFDSCNEDVGVGHYVGELGDGEILLQDFLDALGVVLAFVDEVVEVSD